ncbi:MAG: RNA polymerase sigma factor [Clostridia bacterium]|nr:RNA polymerase sigma factor [Clostridia bacterium]
MLLFLDLIDNGDRRSLFERLYYDYKDDMLKLAMLELDDEEEAEDAVHDAFVYIARNYMGRLESCPEADRRYYMLLTARHRAINRREKRRRELPMESVPGVGTKAALSDGDFIRLIERNESDARFAAMLDALPAVYRDVLFLRFAKDLKGKEIAGLLGMPENTVWKRLERGKKLLAEMLKKEETE